MNEFKAKVGTLLRADTTLRTLLGKVGSPWGVYFSRPPESPTFPLITFKLQSGSLSDAGRSAQSRNHNLLITAYSKTNCDAIMDRIERLLNQAQTFTGMTECKVLNIGLDTIGVDNLDPNFGCYTLTHGYKVFLAKIDQ